MPTAALDDIVTPTRLLGRIAEGVELAALLPAIETAPADARLVVDAITNTAWLGGVELELTPLQFDFVRDVALSTLRRRVLPSKAAGSGSLGSKVGDRARTKMKSEIMKRLREQFTGGAVAMPPELEGKGALFVSRGNGWSDTFAVRVHVRSAP